jgi:hypothetical protein
MTKRADGGVVLRCERSDGTVTWQKQEGKNAAFFPLHDLTHYAVETELGFRAGFYGLICDGWDIDDTTGKGARGRLPPEALIVENIVGLLDVERASKAIAKAADFTEQAERFAFVRRLPAPRPLSQEQLTRVRERIRELFQEWFALPEGGTMELRFD